MNFSMSINLHQFHIDNDTAEACQSMIERAMKRLERGESVHLGGKRTAVAGYKARSGVAEETKKLGAKLSPRLRREVFKAMEEGWSTREIAVQFAIHPATAKWYRQEFNRGRRVA